MKFEYKSAEEISKMSAEEQNKYLADKTAHEKNVIKEEVEKAVKPVSEQVTNLDETLKELSEGFRELSEAVKNTPSDVDASKSIEDWLTENIDAIKTTMKTGAGRMEVKAVGTVTTANGTLPTALPANYAAETSGVDRIALRRPTLLDYVNTYNTNQKTLPYIEPVPGEGDFAQVLEGAEKPQLDIDWVTMYATPVKWAGYIKVTEEVIEDIPRMRDLILNYLRDKHDLKKERDVFTAINTAAVTFGTTGAMAAKVASPNLMDVVNAMQLQIVNSPNYTDEADFRGTVVLMNPSDFYLEFGAAKDGLGRPMFDAGYQNSPVFNYNGYTFIATTLVTAGNILLIDPSKVDVTTYSPYRSEIGWTDKDFIYNMFVLLGESRGHIVIKNHDKRAFVKGSIATIKTNIAIPTPPAG